jgi:predicted nucleic acid-binding protein
MYIVNWGEVYYQVVRQFGEQKAQEIEKLTQTLPITLVEAIKELTREAPRVKVTERMAYADCSAVALARIKKRSFMPEPLSLKLWRKMLRLFGFRS